MLFSSSASAEVERVTTILGQAYIAYDVRNQDLPPDPSGIPYYPEVWVRNDHDFAMATMLVATHFRTTQQLAASAVNARPRAC
jgi:hypothetical protein